MTYYVIMFPLGRTGFSYWSGKYQTTLHKLRARRWSDIEIAAAELRRVQKTEYSRAFLTEVQIWNQ